MFSYLLHPPYLEQDGLAVSLRRFLRGFSIRSGLNVVERIDEGVDMATLAVRRNAFRIVQEAISNVHRHAQATEVVVEIECNERLRLCVADNGRGFGAVAVEDLPLGVGIAGMRARVTQLGGEFAIRSIGRGVVVEAILPLEAV